MKSCYAYIRVSTVKQGSEGSSLAEQRTAIETFAARHGIVIAEWFEEMETAAKRGQPQFARLTALLREGKANGVILHKIDRGARNLKDWADLGELIDAGVEIHLAHEGLDMATRGGRLAADIQAVVAADYIRNLRDEVKKGFYGRLKQGLYPLPAPRGYLNNGKAKPKTIDPLTGPIVRHAFERYATCTISLEYLRHELAGMGLTSAGRNPLGYEALSLMLRNPFYVGIIRLRSTGEVFEGIHQPLIDKATFDRVQAIMNGRLYPRVQKHRPQFRRFLRCSACNRSLTGEIQKGRIYYRCHNRACRGVSLTETEVDTFVCTELASLALSPEDLGDLRDVFSSLVETEKARGAAKIEHLERNLGQVAHRLERLTDALLDEIIDAATYNERKAGLLYEKKQLEARASERTGSTFWRNVAERFELAITAQQSYLSGNSDEKRELLKIFSSNLIVSGKTLYFPMHFPFDEMRNWSVSRDGALPQGAVRTESQFAGLMKAIGNHQDHDHDQNSRCTYRPEISPLSP